MVKVYVELVWDMHFPGKFTRGEEQSTRGECEGPGDVKKTRETLCQRKIERSQDCDQSPEHQHQHPGVLKILVTM